MGKSSPAAPAIPDPTAVASAQGAANKETAIAQARLNQVNETTPYGSSVYTPTGQTNDGIAQMQRTVTLSPAQQAILDKQNALTNSAYSVGQTQIGQIGNTLATPFDLSGLPAAPTGDAAYRQQVQDALYGRATAQLDPRFQQEQHALQTQLANQGFSIGSEGYNNQMENFARSKNAAYESALQDSIINGGNAASQQFGLESGARQAALQERLAARNQPINELAALLGTSGGVNVPQFSGIPQTQVASTDVTGPTYQSYQAAQNQYNQAQNANNSAMGSLFGLGGTALGAWLSSEDAKTDKRPVSAARVLDKVQKMPLASYRYKATGNPNMGPMAQDWAGAFGGTGETIEAPQAFGVTMASIKAIADKLDRLERRVG